jgi:hypothetical protein
VRAPTQATETRQAVPETAASNGTLRILLVEDDNVNRRIATLMLKAASILWTASTMDLAR